MTAASDQSCPSSRLRRRPAPPAASLINRTARILLLDASPSPVSESFDYTHSIYIPTLTLSGQHRKQNCHSGEKRTLAHTPSLGLFVCDVPSIEQHNLRTRIVQVYPQALHR